MAALTGPQKWLVPLAKGWCLASLCLAGLFLYQNFVSTERGAPSGMEFLGLFLFPFATVLGLFIAWKKRTLGAALAIMAVLGYYAWAYWHLGDLPRQLFHFLVAAPAFLFLVAELLGPNSTASEN